MGLHSLYVIEAAGMEAVPWHVKHAVGKQWGGGVFVCITSSVIAVSKIQRPFYTYLDVDFKMTDASF